MPCGRRCWAPTMGCARISAWSWEWPAPRSTATVFSSLAWPVSRRVRGPWAWAASVGIRAVALCAIGGAITLFTGAAVWRWGGRQLLLGLAAAGLTFGVGKLIGVAIGH